MYRVRYMAATWIFERAWGKAREYDPKTEPSDRPKFDPRLYSDAELDLIERVLQLLMAPRNAKPPLADGGAA